MTFEVFLHSHYRSSPLEGSLAFIPRLTGYPLLIFPILNLVATEAKEYGIVVVTDLDNEKMPQAVSVERRDFPRASGLVVDILEEFVLDSNRFVQFIEVEHESAEPWHYRVRLPKAILPL